jgi:hypothetical protein
MSGNCVLRLIIAGLLALNIAGCPTTPPNGSDIDNTDNGSFKSATQVTLGDDGAARFTATIGDSDDVDMFNLGVLAPGDGLVIDVQTTGGNLDPVAALFDSREYVHAFNDDREPDASDLNPRLDIVVRGPEGTYFLGIAAFPGGNTTGDYRVDVQVTRGVGVPDPEPQIVFLNWVGGTGIVVPNVGVFDLNPFDASDLGPYGGRTEQMKDRIQQIIEDRYDGFALVLLNSDDDKVPAEPHTKVHFGSRNRLAFAISEQIDTFNADPADDTIIFTGSFRNAFAIVPTFEEMVTAVGNTAAHEVGHLLGLVHTKECSSLMDTTCGNDSLLVEQAFKLAPLDDSVFPLGSQNAPELLGWILGFAGI